jgi:CDP-paratose 2-epimerase
MKKVIVTGACGFIGTCLTNRLLSDGVEVIGIDNLSRPGTENNLRELMPREGFTLRRIDLAHGEKTEAAFAEIGVVDAVFHLAAQVAVTTSYENPRNDFFDNAQASFNVIESVRRYTPGAYALYASTNKVYGHIEVASPVGLNHPLDPYTPYGVSKATGEMYFTEYGRPETGISTLSLRQSCIYGHHQYGVEDQGWMAWFAIANLLDLPITIYGDGKQVRDLLFVDDLIELYLTAFKKRLNGALPVGGGSSNMISLKEGLDLIASITGKPFSNLGYGPVRPGDQPYFVADLAWTESKNIDWKPKMGVREGTGVMIEWIQRNLSAIRDLVTMRMRKR